MCITHRAGGSMYHALGFSTVCYLQAVMTFDPQDIQIAIHWIKNSIDVSNRFRRKDGMYDAMSKMVRRPNYNNYTDGKTGGGGGGEGLIWKGYFHRFWKLPKKMPLKYLNISFCPKFLHRFNSSKQPERCPWCFYWQINKRVPLYL